MKHQLGELSRVEEDLQQAITTLYQTFAISPLRDVIEGREHCVPPADRDLEKRVGANLGSLPCQKNCFIECFCLTD